MSLLTPFKDEEDAMRWYYTPHSMAFDSAPMGIIDYFQMPPQQMFPEQPPVESIPTEIDYSRPVKTIGPASGGVPGSTRISQHMADWILDKYPEQELSNRYEISGWDTSVGTSPETGWIPVYNHPILSWTKEINQEYINSPEYKEYYNIAEQFGETESTADLGSTPPLASLPIIPISDSVTTPLPDSILPPPEPPDYSSFPPLESYDFSGFESYVDSLPEGAYSYEGAIQDYIGRPLTPNEKEMFTQQESNLGNIRNLFDVMSPEDYYSSTPILPPDSFIPENNDGLMNIVGCGIIYPGPVMDNPY